MTRPENRDENTEDSSPVIQENKRRWAQWSLLSLMMLALLISAFVIPFVRRADHVRYWLKANELGKAGIEFQKGQPSPLSSKLGIPNLIEFAFSDIAENYHDSVESIFIDESYAEFRSELGKHIGGCHGLVHLCWYGEIESSMAAGLRSCENLSMLKLNESPQTDSVIKNVEELDHLQVISFNKCGISNIGVSRLKKMGQLKLLLFYETGVSQKSVDELREQLPDCYVFSFDESDLIEPEDE